MRVPAIRVSGLGKRYRIGRAERCEELRQALGGALRRWLRPGGAEADFWALREANFSVEPGEVLGVIGCNGAGKSTLLKLLSRITPPTTGEVRLRGRLASLLEVGTGFHPDFTGRENIYLNGAILGMTKREIDAKFDEIVAFSEVERFLDTPVKRYSSGMYVRLAFAVAAHLEPEILLVDEVLAVGDAQFQKKCLGKMGSVAGGGRTVLFVSHNMTAVENLCSRAILLDRGELVADGAPAEVIGRYLSRNVSPLTERVWREGELPGAEEIRLRRVAVRREDGAQSPPCINSPLRLELDYSVERPGIPLTLSVALFNEMNVAVFNSVDFSNLDRVLEPGRYRSCCHIPADLLNNGGYRVFICFLRNQLEALYYDEAALHFTVEDDVAARGAYLGPIAGVVRPKLRWSLSPL